MEKSIIYCLDTLGGSKFGPKIKSAYYGVSSINWHVQFDRAYENTLFNISFIFTDICI